MQTKETWIEETMESLNGIIPAEGDPLLRERVLRQMAQGEPEPIRIRSALIWKIAACAALLVSINFFTWFHHNGSASKDQRTIKSVATEYFSYIDSYNL
ncbi:MAG: hypothetical protein NTW10_08405 [Bacteroidetes bacterium]|nr:hypothetical protein [Bacteroidota bacterium]